MEKARQEAIQKEPPMYIITVITSSGKKKELTLWQLSDAETGTDSDRLLGKTNETDELFVLRYFDIDPLIKRRSYFFLNNSLGVFTPYHPVNFFLFAGTVFFCNIDNGKL